MQRYLLSSLICLCLAACGGNGGTPEDEIRAWIERGELAAEEKDRRELLSMISTDYADARGNDLEQIGNILRIYFLRQQSVALLTTIDDIAVTGGTAAIAKITVGMAGSTGGALGFDADVYHFEMELEKPGDEWLLIGARWAPLGREVH